MADRAIEKIRLALTHEVPADCYSTGPNLGTVQDYVCVACEALRALAALALPAEPPQPSALDELLAIEEQLRRGYDPRLPFVEHFSKWVYARIESLRSGASATLAPSEDRMARIIAICEEGGPTLSADAPKEGELDEGSNLRYVRKTIRDRH